MNSQMDTNSRVLLASGAAFFAFLWSVLLDWHFVVSEFGLGIGQLGFGALIYTAIVAGWVWALVSAARGSRRAVVTLLIYALLLAAYAVMDLVVYCPDTCPKIWLYYPANWANLVFGLLAAWSAFTGLRRRPAA